LNLKIPYKKRSRVYDFRKIELREVTIRQYHTNQFFKIGKLLGKKTQNLLKALKKIQTVLVLGYAHTIFLKSVKKVTDLAILGSVPL
jgi:hypothetical protein